MEKRYVDTVRLLLDVAPDVFRGKRFAMKGGTAINLFVQDMPRLSVDIDVVYVDHTTSRERALKDINAELTAIIVRLASRGISAKLLGAIKGDEMKMVVTRGDILVKIEVNYVFRGTVMRPVEAELAPLARAQFTTHVKVPTLDRNELYGSKLVAAFDRQHPRDLFDVDGMFSGFGLTPEAVEAFVCYIAGHNRPAHEVIFSPDKDISGSFVDEFQGMTASPFEIERLHSARDRMRRELLAAMTGNQKNFLIGLVSCEPDWSLMRCPHLKDLPAIQWKLRNLAQLRSINGTKFKEQALKLRCAFGMDTPEAGAAKLLP